MDNDNDNNETLAEEVVEPDLSKQDALGTVQHMERYGGNLEVQNQSTLCYDRKGIWAAIFSDIFRRSCDGSCLRSR